MSDYATYSEEPEIIDKYTSPCCTSDCKDSGRRCNCKYHCATCSKGHSWYFDPDKKKTVPGMTNHAGRFFFPIPLGVSLN
jgi:hypothetical protein